MNRLSWLALGSAIALLLVVLIFVMGCASRGIAMRPTKDSNGKPLGNAAPGDACYIESKPIGERPYSCSFVEFDERGDYLDFAQQRHSWEKIRELSLDQNQELLVVIYCHGWKNNSQSGDVVAFNHFLGRLAASDYIQGRKLRVHGLYLAWRGNSFKHALDKDSEDFRHTTEDFGNPVVNDKYRRKLPFLLWIPEQASYWSRKGAAEAKVSGVPIARTIFTAANAAKHFSPPGKTNRVFVIGHSFGALMLEKSFGQACVGALANQWPWKDRRSSTNTPSATHDPLPFDCVVFVNSAAPSIHAKELSDLLWAHKHAMADAGNPDADAPVIISVTSSADWATRHAHRIANLGAPFAPSLQRTYTEGVLATNRATAIDVPQSYFYERTPGHNPLLVDHWIDHGTPGNDIVAPSNHTPAAILAANLNFEVKDPTVFFTSSGTGAPVAWKIGTQAVPTGWSQYKGHSPVKRGNYWIIRCDKRLIAGHNAIWTTNTMELYAALYRLTEVMRRR